MIRSFSYISAGVALMGVVGCSTEIETAASANYRPVFPVETVAETGLLPTGAIYAGDGRGLFAADQRAAHVGDVITVDFTESFRAQKTQTATTSRSDESSIQLPGLLMGAFDNSLLDSGAERRFSGKGSAAQSNSLRGRVTVSVVRVLPGGMLEILGQKKLTLNNGDEYVRISGYLRPEDISADNVVPSDRIANAEITYIGAGDIADAGKQGWLRRGMNAITPF